MILGRNVVMNVGYVHVGKEEIAMAPALSRNTKPTIRA